MLRKNLQIKDKTPKLSIITVCYNEKEVEKTLKSVTEQTFKDFEWILIDGGSDQKTIEIIEKYQQKMDYFVSEKDAGIYNAMNKGILASKGKWLLFLNAGDTLFEDNTLEKVFKNIENPYYSYKNADIIYSKSSHHKDYNDIEGKIIKYPPPNKLNLEFWRQNSLSHASVFIKRKLFMPPKGTLYDENFIISGDFEKWILWKKEGRRFKYLDIIVSKYYKTGVSAKNISLRERERKIILDKYLMKDYETIFTLKLFKKIVIFKTQKRRDNKFLKFYISKIPFLKLPTTAGIKAKLKKGEK